VIRVSVRHDDCAGGELALLDGGGKLLGLPRGQAGVDQPAIGIALAPHEQAVLLKRRFDENLDIQFSMCVHGCFINGVGGRRQVVAPPALAIGTALRLAYFIGRAPPALSMADRWRAVRAWSIRAFGR
jgi:hypothetical protein